MARVKMLPVEVEVVKDRHAVSNIKYDLSSRKLISEVWKDNRVMLRGYISEKRLRHNWDKERGLHRNYIYSWRVLNNEIEKEKTMNDKLKAKYDEKMDWIETELQIKYSADEAIRLRREIMKLIFNYMTSDNIHQEDLKINDLGFDISELLRSIPLTPVNDTEFDWIPHPTQKGVQMHRRFGSMLIRSGNTVINMARFTVCDISDASNPITRPAEFMEVISMAEILPIEFPYKQKKPGCLYVINAGNYRGFTKYLDEVSGEMRDIHRFFDISEEEWKEVPFNVCAKEMAKVLSLDSPENPSV